MDKEYAGYLLEKTKEDYNLIAEDFSITRFQMWNELNFLGQYIIDGERVLDLGCGNGRLYELLKMKSIDYWGVDFSEKLVEIAKAKYPGVNFQTADALNLPFPDVFFDKIISIAVFHHIPSGGFRLQFLKESKRVLKPGGELILTVWNLAGWRKAPLFLKCAILKIFGRTKLDFGDAFMPWKNEVLRYVHRFSKNELKELVKEAGFKVKNIEILKRPKGRESNILLMIQKPSMF